jgi:hypothetical protein
MLIKTRTLPKLQMKKVITQDAMMAVSGKPGIYASHTNGTTCDTTSGCNC